MREFYITQKEKHLTYLQDRAEFASSSWSGLLYDRIHCFLENTIATLSTLVVMYIALVFYLGVKTYFNL